MTDQSGPSLSKRGEAALAARRAREAEALRDNLRRRKQQQRAIEVPETPPPAPAETDPRPGRSVAKAARVGITP